MYVLGNSGDNVLVQQVSKNSQGKNCATFETLGNFFAHLVIASPIEMSPISAATANGSHIFLISQGQLAALEVSTLTWNTLNVNCCTPYCDGFYTLELNGSLLYIAASNGVIQYNLTNGVVYDDKLLSDNDSAL